MVPGNQARTRSNQRIIHAIVVDRAATQAALFSICLMPNLEQDSRFIKEALPQLQEYLLSNELYWPLRATLPRLTPGALLLALTRLDAISSPTAAYKRAELDAIRAKWRTAWEQKSIQETRNRLKLWSASIDEWQSATGENLADYMGAVRHRTILQLLLDEIDAEKEQIQLRELDLFLQAHLKKSEFLWEKELQSAFPKDIFWFLYGKLI